MPDSVELIDSETVAERGFRRVTWFVRVADAWVGAARVNGATMASLDQAPGTSWESRIEVSLERGTWLMRVESRPGETSPKSALGHLQAGAFARPRHVARRWFRVGRGGQLVERQRFEDARPATRSASRTPRGA